ncbi:uncharacterized protein LOC141915073 [Tubulanus polymorphus]|uniref:uncharacterized protein LOC141915073 n=1 Tax=Tubulanus polymorphus TaxID=672921 RepID=UPI003DA24DF4
MAAPIDDDDLDIFKDLIDVESRFQSEGFEKGFEAGKESGFMEGFNAGVEQGRSIGSEIGFYNGFTKRLLTAFSADKLDNEDKKYKRKVKALTSFQKMLMDFDMENTKSENFSEDLESIRAKFKQVCSLMKASSSAQDNAGLQF